MSETPLDLEAMIEECRYEMAHPGLIRGRLAAVPALIAEVERLRAEVTRFQVMYLNAEARVSDLARVAESRMPPHSPRTAPTAANGAEMAHGDDAQADDAQEGQS